MSSARGPVLVALVANLLIGVMLMAFALVLANRNRRPLIGDAVHPDEVRAIDEAVVADPVVEAVLGLKTMHLNAHDVLVALDIHFRDNPPPPPTPWRRPWTAPRPPSGVRCPPHDTSTSRPSE